MIITIVACLWQGNRRFVFHHIRLECVGRRILLCAVCAHHEIHADTPPFVNMFYVCLLSYSVKKDHFQWAICHPLNVIEFWCDGNYSSLNLFALIWNFNEFFWVTEEMSIWSQRSFITPGKDPLKLPSIPCTTGPV